MGKYTQIVCAKRYTDSNQKKPGIDILIADKMGFKAKIEIRIKEKQAAKSFE